MPQSAKKKRAVKKSSHQKKKLKKKAIKKKISRKTATKKKTAKKKTAKKKTAKKNVKKKKAAIRKPSKKGTAKKTARKARQAALPKRPLVEPGAPPGGLPPVEEPVSNEEAIGTVTHYYSHLGVAVIQINKGVLNTGAQIHIKGHSTDFNQQVESMEYEHQHVDEASAGQSVGIKVADHAREHDIVYLIK
jgi:hypothetical protein